MTRNLKAALAIAAAAVASQAFADVTLYQVENLRGRAFTATADVPNLERFGFSDRASSVEVTGDRRERWEVCEDVGYGGRCAVLRPGSYSSILAMGLNNRISSVRRIDVDAPIADNRYAPLYREERIDYRRRDGERLYEARVTDVRAVVSGPTQRCWVEREQIVTNQPSTNVGGAVAGAVIGGILGHQIGGGSGRDAATALGVVGGAAVGANAGSGQRVVTQDVQRCEQRMSNARPDYYDVSYVFEGREHRVQMAVPPGSHIVVNGNGEPRG